MTQLTKMQTALIGVLKYMNVEEDAIVGIMLMLKEENQIIEMGYWIANNRQASQSQILEKAVELSYD